MHRLLLGKNKSVLSYRTYDLNPHDNEDIDIWLEVCKPSTSLWWDTLPNFKTTRNISEIFKQMFEKEEKVVSVPPTPKTMKNCPGVLGLFRSTILLKAPMDMEIHLKDTDEGTTQIVSECSYPPALKVESHPNWQFSNLGSTWASYRSVKFKFPFIISSTHPYIFVQPYWHNPTPFEVPPGGLFGTYYKHEALNLNTFYKINGNQEYDTFKLRKGMVLGYMVFPYPVSLKHNPKLHIDARLTMLKNGSIN